MLRKLSTSLLLLAALLGAGLMSTLPLAAGAEAPYATGPSRTAGGSGKFYMGREIARVMGHPGASWLDRPERESEERPNRLIHALGLKPGDVVADIGAGTGYFSFRIAPLVPQGKVIAVDIQPEMLGMIEDKQRANGIRNVEPWLGAIDDPKLAPASVDLVLMVDVYHEFSHPREMMTAIVRALKPGGRVALVEYRAEDSAVPILAAHKMSEAQAVKEMQAVGLRWKQTVRDLPWQHLMLFALE
jgi:ubiquinone/menaquinone biosynthesis C-methylase UbiE